MSTYWDISTLGSNEDWKVMLQDMDKLCDSVPESQKKKFIKNNGKPLRLF